VVSFVAAVKDVSADTVNVTIACREREGRSRDAFTVVEDPEHGTSKTTFTQRDEPEPGAPQRTLTLFLADSDASGARARQRGPCLPTRLRAHACSARDLHTPPSRGVHHSYSPLNVAAATARELLGGWHAA
jgi:hypothetical protein